MTPITPVLPRQREFPEVVYAKDQPEYLPLPAVRLDDGTVITRWNLTWRERLQVVFGGSIWLSLMTFNKPLQPVRILTEAPEVGYVHEG